MNSQEELKKEARATSEYLGDYGGISNSTIDVRPLLVGAYITTEGLNWEINNELLEKMKKNNPKFPAKERLVDSMEKAIIKLKENL